MHAAPAIARPPLNTIPYGGRPARRTATGSCAAQRLFNSHLDHILHPSNPATRAHAPISIHRLYQVTGVQANLSLTRQRSKGRIGTMAMQSFGTLRAILRYRCSRSAAQIVCLEKPVDPAGPAFRTVEL